MVLCYAPPMEPIWIIALGSLALLAIVNFLRGLLDGLKEPVETERLHHPEHPWIKTLNLRWGKRLDGSGTTPPHEL